MPYSHLEFNCTPGEPETGLSSPHTAGHKQVLVTVRFRNFRFRVADPADGPRGGQGAVGAMRYASQKAISAR